MPQRICLLIELLEGGDLPNSGQCCSGWDGTELELFNLGYDWPLCYSWWGVAGYPPGPPCRGSGYIGVALECPAGGQGCEDILFSFISLNEECFAPFPLGAPSGACPSPCATTRIRRISCSCDPFELVFEIENEFGCDGQYTDSEGYAHCHNPFGSRRWRFTFRQCADAPPPPPEL